MLSSDKYSVLIAVHPKWSTATYLDSGTTPKDYTRIKGVLNEALEGYAKNGGSFEKKAKRIIDNTHKFYHGTGFHCIKQKSGNVDAFYVLLHMKSYVRDAVITNLPYRLQEWATYDEDLTDDDLRADFHRIQLQLSKIILEDVKTAGGSLHNARGRNLASFFSILDE